MSKLIIIGAGGHGFVAADCAEQMSTYSDIVFLDDNGDWVKSLDLPFSYAGTISERTQFSDDDHFFVAFGSAEKRQALIEQLQSENRKIATLIHPSSTISPHASIGVGSIVCANSAINPAAEIRVGAIINTGATVDHHCQIGEFAHICPGVNLAGNVVVGKKAWVGIGSAVIQGTTIGESVMVGAGASVVSNIDSFQTVVGVPAKPIKSVDK